MSERDPMPTSPATPVETRRPVVLIVDDREDLLRFCTRCLGEHFELARVASGREAVRYLAENPEPDAILLDRDFSHAPEEDLIGESANVRNEGLQILRWLRERCPDLPVLMVTGYREQQAAVEAADLGADFLAWQDLSEHPDMLRARLERALELSGSRPDGVLLRFRELGIVSDSLAYRRALIALYQAIPGNGPILLLGETGSGKDTLAFAVHALCGDSSRPYVSVNLPALNANLIENELFGHARGAYTGAAQAHLGKLRYSDGGTLFLNEIGDLPLDLQAKLLTALERGEVVPVGDVRSYPARFRLITATSRDLKALMQTDRFRRDLYHRIAWHTVTIPPLRERKEDIPALVRTFLREAGQGQDGNVVGIAREAVEYLCELPWEGNVRELRAVVEAATATARYVITLPDVREIIRRNEPRAFSLPEMLGAGSSAPPSGAAGIESHGDVLQCERQVFGGKTYREVTERYYNFLFDDTRGRLPEVARRAGIGKATAYEWKVRFGRAAEE